MRFTKAGWSLDRFERFIRSPVYCAGGGDTMTALREQEIERRLEQSKRLLKGTVDPTTTERIGRLIGELEQEIQLDKEK
jgi:predicted transcriptional regulator of viral defense system